MEQRSVEEQVDSAERDARIMAMLAEGKSQATVAAHFGLSRPRIAQIKKRVLDDIRFESVEDYRAQMAERLEHDREQLALIRDKEHLTVSHGHVVRIGRPVIRWEPDPDDPDADLIPVAVIEEGHGDPVLDDGPRLQAIAQSLKVEDRWAKLFGLDAPSKVELSGATQVEVKYSGFDPEEV